MEKRTTFELDLASGMPIAHFVFQCEDNDNEIIEVTSSPGERAACSLARALSCRYNINVQVKIKQIGRIYEATFPDETVKSYRAIL